MTFPVEKGEGEVSEGGEQPSRRRSVTKDKCVHRLEGVTGRRSVLTPC